MGGQLCEMEKANYSKKNQQSEFQFFHIFLLNGGVGFLVKVKLIN